MKLEELVGKPITEAQFDEAAGKKDACYHKVKARYDVWPSAYASGALVKCRKVGAANWGNKSKKKEGLGDRISKISKRYAKGQKKSKKALKNKKGPYQEGLDEGQKRRASDILRKFDMAYIKFSQEVRDVMKLMDKSTGNKTDSRIINKAYGKHLIPFDDIMQSWARGQQNNPKIDESVNEKRGTCWVGYKQVGMKDKGGRKVPNCVKEIYEIFYEEAGKGHGYTFEYINDGKLT